VAPLSAQKPFGAQDPCATIASPVFSSLYVYWQAPEPVHGAVAPCCWKARVTPTRAKIVTDLVNILIEFGFD